MLSVNEKIFYSEKINGVLSDEALIGSMLRFEAAVALSQARSGIIPSGAAQAIERNCTPEKLNFSKLAQEARLGGNVVIPLVKQLTKLVGEDDREAANYVHFGVTSQDVIDSSYMICLKEATIRLERDLQLLVNQLADLTRKHRGTIMAGRTFLQQARPITFGLKTAGWLDALLRSRKSIREELGEAFTLQLGGAVGTLSSMQDHGIRVAEALGEMLGLAVPDKPWHSQRDRLVSLASCYGILTGNLGKMAKDISLLSQTEIAEVMEPVSEGKGGSSAMPHKVNPAGCICILANSARVPSLLSTLHVALVGDHERATGLWHAEWQTITDLVQLTGGALARAVEITDGLVVDGKQMLNNLELTRGLIYAENVAIALAPLMDRAQAHLLIEQCCLEARRNSLHLKDVCLNHPMIRKLLEPSEIEVCFDPTHSLGVSKEFIDRVLERLG
jgi:3-carboxy-cis,cis-muconate cycloisomerase